MTCWDSHRHLYLVDLYSVLHRWYSSQESGWYRIPVRPGCHQIILYFQHVGSIVLVPALTSTTQCMGLTVHWMVTGTKRQSLGQTHPSQGYRSTVLSVLGLKPSTHLTELYILNSQRIPTCRRDKQTQDLSFVVLFRRVALLLTVHVDRRCITPFSTLGYILIYT